MAQTDDQPIQTNESTKTTAEIIKEKKEAVKEQSDAAKSIEPEATDKKEDKKEDEVDATEAMSLLAQGNRNLHCGEVATAITQLEEACRLLAAKHGETSDLVADAYYTYGWALLEMSRIESGVLGNALQGIDDDTENSADETSADERVEDPDKVTGEEREEIEDQVIDAMTEEREEKKPDDKAEEETPKSQTNGDANGDAKPVTNGHTNGVNGHSTTNGVNGHSETNGDANPKDTSNGKEKQNGATNGDKETGEKATEDIKTEDKKADAKEVEEKDTEKAEIEEKDTEDKENEKPTEMETDKPKDDDSSEKGEETEGTDAESEDLEGEAEPQDGEEQGEEDAKEGGSKEPEEEVSNLQLAWEMLELSKIIFSRGTTKELKLKTSDAYLKLGEVGLETEQYQQAIGDFKCCLKIQQENLSPESRLIAETHYSIGLACCFCGLYDESVSNYKSAVAVMESKIAKLQTVIDEIEKKKADGAEISVFDDPTPETKKEMKDLEDLLPEIRAKIEDTLDEQSSQEKVKKLVKENIAMDTDGTTVTTGFGEQPESSTETSDEPKSACDITHLVRKKRKQDDEEEEESTKKAKVEESDSKKEESKPEESKSEDNKTEESKTEEKKEEKKEEKDQKNTDEKMDAST